MARATEFRTKASGPKGAARWLACLLLPALAHAQLNDTGQIVCTDSAGAAIACNHPVNHAGQDGRVGRDAQAGAAAFDFQSISGGDCVVDRVTGLIWSAQTLDGTWASVNTAANSHQRCDIDSGWRLPTRRELLSIVHHGTHQPATAFPATQSAPYWSADVQGGNAWAVDFGDGDTQQIAQDESHAARPVVRLVNQPPTITPGADIVLSRGDRPGPLVIPGWATGIAPGPSREAWQRLTANVELLPLEPGDPKALAFDALPVLDPATGDLSFTLQHRIDYDDGGDPYRDEWVSSAGLARLRLTLRDDGGTADGGQDSTTAEFTIFLDPVPLAHGINIKHPWRADCIPFTLLAMDADTDPVIPGTWEQGDPWPYPTVEIVRYPNEGFITPYVARTPGGEPQGGIPDLLFVMSPRPPHLGWDNPLSLRLAANFSKTWCYVPFGSTQTGVDSFTYRITDPDGNVSNTATVSIEIFEVR